MSAWVVGLALGTAYLITRNGPHVRMLESTKEEYYAAANPSTNGTTSAEVRKAWGDINFSRFGDMREELAVSQKMKLDEEVKRQQAEVQAFDAGPSVPEIQGVMMTFDRLGI